MKHFAMKLMALGGLLIFAMLVFRACTRTIFGWADKVFKK